jgi:hypothetical protein
MSAEAAAAGQAINTTTTAVEDESDLELALSQSLFEADELKLQLQRLKRASMQNRVASKMQTRALLAARRKSIARRREQEEEALQEKEAHHHADHLALACMPRPFLWMQPVDPARGRGEDDTSSEFVQSGWVHLPRGHDWFAIFYDLVYVRVLPQYS